MSKVGESHSARFPQNRGAHQMRRLIYDEKLKAVGTLRKRGNFSAEENEGGGERSKHKNGGETFGKNHPR